MICHSNAAAEEVGKTMRNKWIQYINGDAPWGSKQRYAFGPFGKCGEVDDDEFSARRRTKIWGTLKLVDIKALNSVIGALASGRISFDN
jgi:hypothetical protein